MSTDISQLTLTFAEYFEDWIKKYKLNNVRPVTYKKYEVTLRKLKEINQDIKLEDLNRAAFQDIITTYCQSHEHATAMDFYHHLKGSLQDAFADGLIQRDPTRRIVVKGKPPTEKKLKYLSWQELQLLVKDLDVRSNINLDCLLYLIAKTGLRFAEALGLTPEDFDFEKSRICVNKTWDYKTKTGFSDTKNKQSVRYVQIDWQTNMLFLKLLKEATSRQPVFITKGKDIYNSTANAVLKRHCQNVGIPVISVHSLRHTHASVLLFSGVFLASVSARLGHADISITQKIYLHIIRELDAQDTDIIMRQMSLLTI